MTPATSAISAGIQFLRKTQHQSGVFSTARWLADQTADSSQSKPSHSLFASLLIGQAISRVAPDIAQHLVELLETEFSPDHSLNYWLRSAPENADQAYPDDLDDTIAGLTLIQLVQPEKITGQQLAALTKLLSTVETTAGGPYKTWLVDQATATPEWQDVDVAVNANVAYGLHSLEIELPPLTKWLDDQIAAGQIRSPYYVGPLPVLYFLSRQYQGREKKKLIKLILQHQNQDKTWDTPLATALAVSSLIRLGQKPAELTSATEFLLQSQHQRTGSWPKAGLVIEKNNPTANQTMVCGSSALTTALCLEALNLATATDQTAKPTPKSAAAATLSQASLELTTQILETLPPELAKPITTHRDAMLDTDTHQIAAFPGLFHQSLAKSHQEKVPLATIHTLGAANIFGWLAYTLFDDVLDEEGRPNDLPIAQTCLRLTQNLYAQLANQRNAPELNQLFTATLHRIDAANLWEVSQTRLPIANGQLELPAELPQYPDSIWLADKSLGHALGPAAIVLLLGHDRDSQPVSSWFQLAQQLLAARQLNDDAHDWLADLERGQVNFVGARVLAAYRGLRPGSTTLQLNQATKTKLHELFWTEIAPETLSLIQDHCYQATQLIQDHPLIAKPDFLLKMVEKIAAAADQAELERTKALEFLDNYKP